MEGDYVAFDKWRDMRFLLQYDVILLIFGERTPEMAASVWRDIRSALPDTMIIGAFENRLQKHKEWCMTKQGFFSLFVDFMDTVDVFLSDAPDCVEYFQLFSDTPVRFILYPYPLEYVSKFRVPLEKRDKRILKMGVTGGRIGSEGHDALLLMRSILDEYRAFDGYAVSMDGTWNGSAGFGKIQFHTERPWKEFLKDVVSRSYIAIDLDSAHTHGRTAADCAALGVPCIGVNSSAQQLLFPKLTFGETEYAAMKDAMLTLLNDRTFWLQCSEEAMSFSEMYSYSAARDEMERLYREWKNGVFEKSTERGI